MLYKDKLGHEVSERFTSHSHKDGDENVITVRDNLTKDERTWGDFWGIEEFIQRWEQRQREKQPG